MGCSLSFPGATWAQFDFEQPPIGYRAPATQNAVARLEQKIRSGEVTLKPDASGSYLAAILDSLDIPVSSQSLVFTKTSLQQARISPHSPRAIYFNDECYVGWVQDGFIEIGVMDDRLGGVFYTVNDRSARPEFYRDRGACLGCHATGKTERVPGFFIRSVYPDAEGFARDFGTVSDHRSPFNSRWGGWYVTGSHGDMRHLGNELAIDSDDEEKRAGSERLVTHQSCPDRPLSGPAQRPGRVIGHGTPRPNAQSHYPGKLRNFAGRRCHAGRRQKPGCRRQNRAG
jgi:hypothetical protein